MCKHLQCDTCKHRLTNGHDKRRKNQTYGCYYAVTSGKGSALKVEAGELIDKRGEDPRNCKLYEEGNSIARENSAILICREGLTWEHFL